ncbi:hypothetical protein [Streptomyces sp. NPDC054797]
MQEKHQEPGKGREEQERMHRPGQDPAAPARGREGARGKSPEELRQRREEERRGEAGGDEQALDDEL